MKDFFGNTLLSCICMSEFHNVLWVNFYKILKLIANLRCQVIKKYCLNRRLIKIKIWFIFLLTNTQQ